MAVGAKRLIPRCMGARILLSSALSPIFCLRIAVGQEPASKHPGRRAQSAMGLTNRQVGQWS